MKLIKFIDEETEKSIAIYAEDIRKYEAENEYSTRIYLDLHDLKMSYVVSCGMDDLFDLLNVPATEEDFQVIDFTTDSQTEYEDEDMEELLP